MRHGDHPKSRSERLKEDTFFVEKHWVAILLNKKWRYRIVDTDHISERAISTTNKQKFMQMSVCFSHSGICRPPRRKIALNNRKVHEKQRSTSDHLRRLQHRTGTEGHQAEKRWTLDILRM